MMTPTLYTNSNENNSITPLITPEVRQLLELVARLGLNLETTNDGETKDAAAATAITTTTNDTTTNAPDATKSLLDAQIQPQQPTQIKGVSFG